MIYFTYRKIEEPITKTLESRITKARMFCFNVCRKWCIDRDRGTEGQRYTQKPRWEIKTSIDQRWIHATIMHIFMYVCLLIYIFAKEIWRPSEILERVSSVWITWVASAWSGRVLKLQRNCPTKLFIKIIDVSYVQRTLRKF